MPHCLLAAALLVGACAMLWWFAEGDLLEYRRFKRLQDGRSRRARYRIWVARALLAFALPTLVAAALLGRLDALVTMPAEFLALGVWLPVGRPETLGPYAVGGAIGIALGVLLLVVATWWRGPQRGPPRTLGDIGALMPRSREELPYGALLALTAGVTEELMFRLLLPLLVTIVSGSALAGFVVATALFGAMHRYQGWLGVAATTVVGTVFAALYLVTGLLWAAMAFHVIVDLNGLVLRPVLGGAWRRRD